ncbi:hypothetical protein ACF1A5_05485 [Streptomyces sp. NPDC014864]|uniref:hypothetical protein n=1 Tax=Streptomyces sp. NPDC014864 TaxID=3364924 RepID=UPI0036F97354
MGVNRLSASSMRAGQGVVLIAEGNVGLYQRPDLVYRPVLGLPEAELAIAWHVTDRRPEVTELVTALTGRARPSTASEEEGQHRTGA